MNSNKNLCKLNDEEKLAIAENCKNRGNDKVDFINVVLEYYEDSNFDEFVKSEADYFKKGIKVNNIYEDFKIKTYLINNDKLYERTLNYGDLTLVNECVELDFSEVELKNSYNLKNFLKNSYREVFDTVVKNFKETSLAQVSSKLKLNDQAFKVLLNYLVNQKLGFSKEEFLNYTLNTISSYDDYELALSLLEKIEDDSYESTLVLYKLAVLFMESYDDTYKHQEELTKEEYTYLLALRDVVVSSLEKEEALKIDLDLRSYKNKTIRNIYGEYLSSDSFITTSLSEEMSKEELFLPYAHYLAGLRSIYPGFKEIKNLVILNPVLGKAYVLELKNISEENVEAIYSFLD